MFGTVAVNQIGNTRSRGGQCRVGQVMLQILGSVAEFERSPIREGAMAGQIAAIGRGRWPDRQKVLTGEQQFLIVDLWTLGVTKAELTRRFGCSYEVLSLAILRVVDPDNRRVRPTRPALGPFLEC